MSSRRWYIETSPDGRHQFVQLKRSRSHHHHGHHHESQRCCREDCCHVGRDDWNALVERERKLREANEILTRENHSLKYNFHAAETEARRLAGIVPILHAENQALRDENASLRCSIENAGDHSAKHHHLVEKLHSKINKLEKERDGLLARIKELSRHAHHSIVERFEELRRKFDVVDDHNKRLRRDIDHQQRIIEDQDERIRVYERILRRHGFLS